MFHKRPALEEPYWVICLTQRPKKSRNKIENQIPINAKLQNIYPQAPTFSGFVFAGGTTLASLAQVQASPQHRAPGKGRVPCHIGTRETAVALEASCFGERDQEVLTMVKIWHNNVEEKTSEPYSSNRRNHQSPISRSHYYPARRRSPGNVHNEKGNKNVTSEAKDWLQGKSQGTPV